MGIKLGGSSDFDQTLFRLKQAKVGEPKVTTEAEFISLLSNDTDKEFVGASGSYYTSERELVNEGDTMDVPSSSPASNFTLTSIRKVVDPEEHEEGEEKYSWTNITVYFQHKTEYRYDDNIWSNNSRVIYQRKVCYQSAAVPVSDGYVGSETISVEFRFKELIEEEKPVPVNPTTYGAFPSGIGVEFCILACKTDKTFADNYSLDALNEYANTYEQTRDPSKETLDYFASDSGGNYVYLVKDAVDTRPLGGNNEVLDDWERLYPSETFQLANQVDDCYVEGQDEPVPCYKVYLAGKCQLLDADGQALIDSLGGQTELARYDFPNGYYILINKTLYLFLLTDFDTAIWEPDGTTVTMNDHSSLGAGVHNLTSRTVYGNNNYYVYEGTNTPYINAIGSETVILGEIQNLRHIVMSDSITNVGHLGGITNPDTGFYFPKYLKYIGPLTITYTAGTKAFVYTDYLEEISDYAFYNGLVASGNLSLFMAKAEELELLKDNNYRTEHGLGRGYIAPGPTLRKVGEKAFFGITAPYLNLTACSGLNDVSLEAFAMSAECKNFYFRPLQLSQRDNVSNPNLIYLPDQIVAGGVSGLDIPNEIAPYDSPEIADRAVYATDTTHKTLGEIINGYRIHLRTSAVGLNDLF